jgi:hypothetical protein
VSGIKRPAQVIEEGGDYLRLEEYVRNMGDGHAFMRFVLQPDLIDD